MKKQIKDLRLGDIIYEFNGPEQVQEYRVTGVTEKRLSFVHVKHS